VRIKCWFFLSRTTIEKTTIATISDSDIQCLRERETSRRRRERENSSGEEVYKGAKKEERQKGREDIKGKRVQKGSESMKGNSLNMEREK